jgi:hypothetical protein
MAQRAKRDRRPGKGPDAPAAIALSALARALGMPLRSLYRLRETGVIVPAVPGAGSRGGRYDPIDCARRILAERSSAATPRDRREEAQARLLELRYKREAREVLDVGEVVRQGRGVILAVTARLLRLPSDLVRAGVIPSKGEAAVERHVREALEELARLDRIEAA